MKPYTTKLRCFYFWRPETRSAGDFTHSLPGSCAIKFNMAGNVQFLDLTPSQFDFPDEEDNDYEELIRYYFYKGFTCKEIR